MRITFLGGADEVGASSILIEISGRRLLIDAGIRPSPKARWGLSGDQLPHLSAIEKATGRPQESPLLDAILVTHAHTDHTGALELVVERFPNCPVYATPPTIALTRVLHADARRIMQTRLDEEGELPLFDEVAVQKLLSAFVPVPFRARLPLGEGLAAMFYPAGHIAGAAMIALDSDEGRVLISGDVSVSAQRTVDGLKPPPFHPDVLILESTYGGRLHSNRATEERRLIERVTQVTSAGGKVLIPAFALGRAQELIEILRAFRKSSELPSVSVWVDGMVRAVCGVYSQFPEMLPLALQERGARFFDEYTRPIERVEQRNALVWETNPVVIIASSGMLAGGPSLSYARALAGQPQHAILLTGYQDEESPGRRLQEMATRGHGSLKLGKDVVDVQCQLGTYSLSAHADEGQLISLTETLDPTTVLLVHGDAPARASLFKALRERGRRVETPHTGQSFEFHLRASPTARTRRAREANRPLELRALWNEIAAPGGNYFTLSELARAWWGDEAHADELRDALEKDDAYFALDDRGLARARTREQIERTEQRVAQMSALPDVAGSILILRDAEGNFRATRVASISRDHLIVEGDSTPHYPEEIIERIGMSADVFDAQAVESLAATFDMKTLLAPGAPRTLDEIAGEESPTAKAALSLALLRAGAERTPDGYVCAAPIAMEPNQALAFAREQFPPEARLRRIGYRLDERVLVLTFDFPDAAREHFGEMLARLSSDTGWRTEVDPEANQASLAALAREALPLGWEIVKGPSIYRDEKRVAVAAREGAGELAPALERFRATSGYALSVTIVESDLPEPVAIAPTIGAMEINAALGLIRSTLANSTLYRASLKGNAIVLSFISPQVGTRYREQIEELARTLGWSLAINPNPNQNAILEVARTLVTRAGWNVTRGPSIHTDRSEVHVVLAALPEESERTTPHTVFASEAKQSPSRTEEIALLRPSQPQQTLLAMTQAEFEAQTGYRLVVDVGAPAESPSPSGIGKEECVEIPIARIRVTRHQQTLTLDPEKQRKTVEQLRRLGRVNKPLRVRRAVDGYILLDGMYRLRAAQALGWERIVAVVEER